MNVHRGRLCEPMEWFDYQLQCPLTLVAAPNFTAQAVVDGEFKTVSLSDYKGK